jgi:glycosyltransferase involved in cell wall biosynthesis
MRVLMVTPHLPPHQAANALLPHLLGQALTAGGHDVSFLTFGDGAGSNGHVTHVKRRRGWLRVTRVPQLLEATETWLKVRPLLARADVVHVHSNTWMNQVAASAAARAGRPYILTHYGTEIWHHDGKTGVFHRMNARAHHVTLYSEALLARARELGVPWRAASVVYPPVADEFRPRTPAARDAVRARYVKPGGTLLLNVKRLHPLADQSTLLKAMARLRGVRPDAVLLIAGSGEAEPALKQEASALGLGESVRFLGLVPNAEVAELQGAADLFVLPSVLEATPTVALEALASGTPVISADNPGGLELNGLFGGDVTVVPRQDPSSLADAILAFLRAPRRTAETTAATLEQRFRLPGVAARYLSLYQEAARG